MTGSLRQYAGRVLAGLLIVGVVAGHAASFYEIGALKRLDRWLYDARIVLGVSGGVDDRIVVVDVDEPSLAEIGRWPWRRDVIATLLDRLFDQYKVKVVGFDSVFAEPDGSSGLPVLDRLVDGRLKEHAELKTALAGLRDELDYDARLARALADRPIVLGYYFSSGYQGRSSGEIGRPVLTASAFEGRQISFSTWSGYGGNLDSFQRAAGTSGHFNVIVDEDGLTRRVPMLAEYRGDYYESLSLAVVRRALGVPPVRPGFATPFFSGATSELEWLGVGPIRVPVDENVAALVPYRGPGGSFRYVSAADVVTGRASAELLADRIVLVGTSAPGLYDLRATPVANVYPGVEAHANLIAGMLDGTLKSRPMWLVGAETLALLVLGIGLAFVLPRLSPAVATLASIAAVSAALGVAWSSWHHGDLVVQIAPLAVAILGLFTLNMVFGYFVEVRAKRQFTQLFGQYVPPELVDRMARDPRKYSTEPRNEILTVLFADLRGFTTIAETLAPNELRLLLNEYLTAMSQVIHQAGGTVDKYMGDAIMAFWGAPVADPDHARHAVVAAVRMQAAVTELHGRMALSGGPPLEIGVGINTGLMNVGDMGSKLRRSYTVLGDPVNLASRLESLTKYYGVGIIIGERTREMLPDSVCRELDRVRVKGKGEAVSIYEPLALAEGDGATDGPFDEELALWNRMLRAYRAQNWDEAELALLNLQRLYPRTTLYELYLSRIVRFRAAPPPAGWDGVTVFDRK